MKAIILLVLTIGINLSIMAQEKIQTEIGLRDDFVYKDGNIGIGTVSPLGELHIRKTENDVNVATADIVLQQFNGKNKISGLYTGTNKGGISFSTNNGSSSIIEERMRILANGNIGIGTVNPGIWKLAVNGNLRAKEIKVETDWSDFVFENTYILPTLKEVEQHITEKGHLKDIPSAKEVEENGIFLGEMDSKLLQKIEELTLYTIQQQKEINTQKEKVEKLEKENKSLKNMNVKLLELQKRLEKLEKKSNSSASQNTVIKNK
jgi:uncharacterized coiled-coil protein SlyX